MPLLTVERMVFVGLGAAVATIVFTMRTMLTQVRDEAEIKQQQPTTQYITQDTEDSLKVSTLHTLLSHYNFAIHEIASKIVLERAVNDAETLDHLLWGITRPDYEERMKYLRTLACLTDAQNMSKFNSPRAYAAFVRSLEHCITDRAPLDKLDDKDFDEYGLRDMGEKICLMFIAQLMQKYGPEQAIQAGLVEKWLAKQNWGDTSDERTHNFFQYLYKTNRIVDIIHRIQLCPIGQRALAKAGLIPKSLAEDFQVYTTVHVETEIIDNDRAEPTPRHREQSPEEQRLRHRHREAMVLNDGTRPFGRSDIIEREHDSPP